MPSLNASDTACMFPAILNHSPYDDSEHDIDVDSISCTSSNATAGCSQSSSGCFDANNTIDEFESKKMFHLSCISIIYST